MKEKIDELLSFVGRERILITKMTEFDEKKDAAFFDSFQKEFKYVSGKTDKLINDLLDAGLYYDSVDYLSDRIKKFVEEKKLVLDEVTLIGLLNNFHLNRVSMVSEDAESDAFSNELITQVYDIYLWSVNNKGYSKELVDSLRVDMINKSVNSRAMRKYFAGDYDEAENISNPLNDGVFEDKNKLGVVYASLMIGEINLSNSFEMYDGIMDELSYESRKKMLEMEFAAISVILLRRGIIIPPNTMDYSDYTEKIIENASCLADEYLKRKEKNLSKLLSKQKN